MKKQFLEAGKITNTHGVYGSVRVQPWADSPEFLQDFDMVYIDGEPRPVRSCRPHKRMLILELAGVDDFEAASALKGKVIYIDRNDAKLPEGHFFIQDILGLPVLDESGNTVGTLRDIQALPAGELYVVQNGDGRDYLIPNVPDYILEKNLVDGYIKAANLEQLKDL